MNINKYKLVYKVLDLMILHSNGEFNVIKQDKIYKIDKYTYTDGTIKGNLIFKYNLAIIIDNYRCRVYTIQNQRLVLKGEAKSDTPVKPAHLICKCIVNGLFGDIDIKSLLHSDIKTGYDTIDYSIINILSKEKRIDINTNFAGEYNYHIFKVDDRLNIVAEYDIIDITALKDSLVFYKCVHNNQYKYINNYLRELIVADTMILDINIRLIQDDSIKDISYINTNNYCKINTKIIRGLVAVESNNIKIYNLQGGLTGIFKVKDTTTAREIIEMGKVNKKISTLICCIYKNEIAILTDKRYNNILISQVSVGSEFRNNNYK